MSREKTRTHFATVYVTVVSVLLGLALEDLVSIIRGLEQRDAFAWLASVFVVHIIMNAWIGYSSMAISVNLEPNVWDALNVFLLSASHFALNSFVGSSPTAFFLAAGVYSLLAGCTTYYNAWRGAQDPAAGITTHIVLALISLNAAGGLTFLTIGLLSSRGALSEGMQLLCVSLSIPFATAWLALFWRSWGRREVPA